MCPAALGAEGDLWQQAMAFLWQWEPQVTGDKALSLHQGGGKSSLSNTPSTCHCEWLPVPTECLCRGHRMFLLRRWVRKPWEAGKCCWCWDCWMQQPVQHRLAEDSDSLTEKSGWMLNFRSDLTEISICRERRYSTNYNRCVFLLQQPHYNAFIPSKLL